MVAHGQYSIPIDARARTRSVILEGANTRPAGVYVQWGVPNVVGAPRSGRKM